MYSHLASNDTTEPLSFVGGWMVNTTVALVGGGYANYGTSDGKAWIDLETNGGLVRLVGVDYEVKKGDAPPSNSGFFYWPVYPDKYIEVAASARIDRIFSHTHQTSFDNVYGNGFKPMVGEVIGSRPVDLLGAGVHQRVDGTKFGDTILLNDAGSVAYSNNGKDTVEGGVGADQMFGGNGNDALYGGGGIDDLNGDNGKDHIYGGEDNDEGRGGAGNDRLFGEGGEDRLYGEWQNDRLSGGDDGDWLYGGDDEDSLSGGGGEDTLDGGRDNDELFGDIDNDALLGQAGNDELYGGIGQDDLRGGGGNDRLYGEDDNDTIYGGGGNDKAFAGIGQDTARGGGGNDILKGEADNDWLHGEAGNDKLQGGIANDFLYGGNGRDRLDGGTDNDRLDGGTGIDVLNGGSGADTFIFSTKLGGGNIDRIADFEVGSDGIWLSQKVFRKLPLGPLPEANFHRGAKAADKDDHIVYDAKRGVLVYDKNGSGKGGDTVFAKVDRNTDLHNSDFTVKAPGELFI